MGRPAKPGYADGFEDGQRVALGYLALAVEVYPRAPSAATARLVGDDVSEPLQEEIRLCLVRFEAQLKVDGRKRKANATALHAFPEEEPTHA